MRRWTGDRFVGELEENETPPLFDCVGLPERVVVFERLSREQLQEAGFEDDSPEYRRALAALSPADAEDLL